MTVIFKDSFTEASDTNIESHTADLGGTWSDWQGVGFVKVKGGANYIFDNDSATGSGRANINTALAVTDYRVSADCVLAGADGSAFTLEIGGRHTANNVRDGQLFGYNFAADGYIYDIGVSQTSIAIAAWPGGTVHFEVLFVGGIATFLVNGVQKYSGATAPNPTNGFYAGIRLGNSAGGAVNNIRISNFLVQKYVVDAPHLSPPWFASHPKLRFALRPRLLGPQNTAGKTLYGLSADAGTYTVAGQTAGLGVGRKVTAATGTYTLAGQTAGLSYGRKLVAAAGSYVLSGQTAGLALGRKLVAAAGSYLLSGQTAGLAFGRKLVAATGSYLLSGQAAVLGAARKLVATAGAYVLSGQSAPLSKGYTMIAAAGSYALTGVAVGLSATRKLVAAAGAYVLSGMVAVLTKSTTAAIDTYVKSRRAQRAPSARADRRRMLKQLQDEEQEILAMIAKLMMEDDE